MQELNIGAKVKRLRQARKLTLQTVARETGFSTALISQIENNNVSPPIATLSKIAKFFDVKIGHFFAEEDDTCRVEVVRAQDRTALPQLISTTHGYSYESLSFRGQNKKMEPFLLHVSGPSVPENSCSHDGEEFIFVLKGTVEIVLDDECIMLTAGDCIYFDSALRHRLSSQCDGGATLLASFAR